MSAAVKNLHHDGISSEFTFVWKVTNLSYCVISKGQKLVSPKFQFSHDPTVNREWQLFFYPRGNSTTSVECALAHVTASSDTVTVYCRFCVCSNEILLCSEEKGIQYSQNCQSEILASFGREVLEKFSDDTIVFHCHMSKSENYKSEDPMHCFAVTRLSIRRCIFHWKVKNFKTLQLDQEIKSRQWKTYPTIINQSVTYSSMSMILSVVLLGKKLQDSTVQIWLTLDTLKTEAFCSVALFLMDGDDDKVVKLLTNKCYLGSIENVVKFSIKRDEIFGGLSTDCLTVRAEVSLSGDNGSMEQEVYGMKTQHEIDMSELSQLGDLLCSVLQGSVRVAQTLDLENFPSVLLTAEHLKDQDLKMQVVEYIITQGPQALESENWKELERQEPVLAYEVLRRILKEKWVSRTDTRCPGNRGTTLGRAKTL